MATTKNLHLMMTADAKSVEATLGRMDKMMSGLKAQTAGLRQATAAVIGGANPFDMIKGGIKSMIESIPIAGKGLVGLTNIAEGFYNKIRAVQKDIGQQGKEAMAAGASIEGYSALRYMASDAEAMAGAMFKLSNAVAEAAINGGDLQKPFNSLKLDVYDLSAMKTDQQFLKLAGALEKVENKSLRNKLAMDILGKSAFGVMGDLAKGEEKLRKAMEIARQHGSVITEQDLAAVKAANKAMKEFDATIDSTWKVLAVQFAPVIKSLGADLRKLEAGLKAPGEAQHDLGTVVGTWGRMFGDTGDFLGIMIDGWRWFALSGKEAADMQESLVNRWDELNSRAHPRDRALQAKKDFLEEIKKSAKEATVEMQKLQQAERENIEAQRQATELEQKRRTAQEANVDVYARFMERLREIDTLFPGEVTNRRMRAQLALVNEFNKVKEKQFKLESPGILERGSREAASVIEKFRTGSTSKNDHEVNVERFLEQLRDTSKETLKQARKVSEQLNKLGLAER